MSTPLSPEAIEALRTLSRTFERLATEGTREALDAINKDDPAQKALDVLAEEADVVL